MLIVLIFILGAAVGSFLNVLISRTIKGKDWVTGRSKCDYCQKELSWYDMIPLLSFAMYRGRSRCCHQPLSWQHPIVEILTASMFVWWYVMGNVFFQLANSPMRTMQALYWLLIGIVLLVIVVGDAYYGYIVTLPVVIAVIASIGYRLLLFWQGPLLGMHLFYYFALAIFSTLFFYLLHWATKGKGMGMGDVYVAPLYGLILGWPRAMVGIILSFWMGAIFAIVAMLFKKKKLKQTIAFGPFMVAGMVVALMWGNKLWEIMFNS